MGTVIGKLISLIHYAVSLGSFWFVLHITAQWCSVGGTLWKKKNSLLSAHWMFFSQFAAHKEKTRPLVLLFPAQEVSPRALNVTQLLRIKLSFPEDGVVPYRVHWAGENEGNRKCDTALLKELRASCRVVSFLLCPLLKAVVYCLLATAQKVIG